MTDHHTLISDIERWQQDWIQQQKQCTSGTQNVIVPNAGRNDFQTFPNWNFEQLVGSDFDECSRNEHTEKKPHSMYFNGFPTIKKTKFAFFDRSIGTKVNNQVLSNSPGRSECMTKLMKATCNDQCNDVVEEIIQRKINTGNLSEKRMKWIETKFCFLKEKTLPNKTDHRLQHDGWLRNPGIRQTVGREQFEQ